VAAFVGVQLGFTVVAEWSYPRLYDPEYGSRLALLRDRHREARSRPLLLVIGSSRLLRSFRPELLPPLRTAGGERPLPFNFAHGGAGPVFNLMNLYRLLGEGLRPRWLVVEVMPPYLAHDGEQFFLFHMGAKDLPLLGHYLNPLRLYGKYLRKRLLSGRRFQTQFLYRHAPDLVPWANSLLPFELAPLGGPAGLEAQLSPAELGRRTAIAQGQYQNILRHFRVTPVAARALHELVAVCRREGIALTLLVTPEGSTFRSWYGPGAQEQMAAFLHDLSQGLGVPVVDARSWLADSDFYDSHHTLASGAAAFTRRLGREVLRPLVAGRLR
jgi:hypothetical protein